MFYECKENQVVRVQREVWIKFSIKDFFSKCDQIRKKLRIWLHLLKKSLMENFNCRFTIKTIISGYARAEPWNQVVRMQWNQGRANAMFNEIVGKLFRLCRCRTIKSSCKNVVRIRLCKRSTQWYCQQRFHVVQI